MSYTATELAAAVSAICPDIEDAIRAKRGATVHDEAMLWRELSCCVLSSQVPYELAVEYARQIAEASLLISPVSLVVLTKKLEALLRTPALVGGRRRMYRFPSSKAHQLARTRAAVTNAAGTLTSLINSFESPTAAREWFSTFAPGVGPKQASMFLRNVGLSYELAVLDRHVISYMHAQELLSSEESLARLVSYSRVEERLSSHAAQMGHEVGYLDWAIWIVMRVAGQGGSGALA
jgi:N-glycosylase/DNA lyase